MRKIITFWVADENNGIFEQHDTRRAAERSLEKYITDGINAEKDIQDETGYTEKQIEERVRGFYNIIETTEDISNCLDETD